MSLPAPTRIEGSTRRMPLEAGVHEVGRASEPGIPVATMLQGRPLDEFVAAEVLDTGDAPDAEKASQRVQTGPFGSPGGALPAGLRTPSGPVGSAFASGPDFRARSTGFYRAWGTPPNSEFFRWDPSRDHYQAQHPPYAMDDTPAGREWDDAVTQHHAALAQRGIYLQAYKPGGQYGTGPWQYRWIEADDNRPVWDQQYRVVKDGYESLGYDGPSVQDFERDRERAIEDRERMIERISGLPPDFAWVPRSEE
jgi:hypothetical protein